MNSNHTKEIRIINIIVFFMVIFTVIVPSVLVRQCTGAVYISPADFSNGSETLEHRLRTQGEAPADTFTTQISMEDLAGLPKTDLGIVITRMDGQGYKLWWNDRFIGQSGDPYKGRANIWNASSVFLVEGDLIEKENTLTIYTYALYEVGTYENSIQITSWREAIRIQGRYDLLSSDLTMISIGMTFYAAITILVHTILNAHNKKKMQAIMLAMLAMAIYGIDYLKIDYLGAPYLLYKKVITASLYFSVFFISISVSSTVKRKLPLYISGGLLIGYIIGELLIRDMIVFKMFYNYATSLLPINMIIWLVVLSKKTREKTEAQIFFGMLAIVTLVVLWEVASLLFLPNELVASPFPLVMIAGALLTMFLALSSVERNRQLQAEIEQKDALHLRAINDAQTGVFNKPHFSTVMESFSPPFSVAMFDIDNFKMLNDKRGHLIGDEGILTVVQTIRANLKASDILGRYGGDEFMAALVGSPFETEAVCEKIRNEIEKAVVEHGGQQVKITVSIGIYHVKKAKPAEGLLMRADRALYAAKAAGKNCLKIYQKSEKDNYQI